MAKARITLTGALSMSKGRFKFVRNQTVVSEDAALIKECQNDGQFAVTVLEEEKKPTKAPAAKEPPAADAGKAAAGGGK